MHQRAGDMVLAVSLVFASLAVTVASADALQERVRASGTARIVVDQDDLEAIDMQVNGDRIKEDGRLRYVGSVARSKGIDLVRWDFAGDPNPYGGASIEGAFEVEGPFVGVLVIDLPLDPHVEGRVALKSSTMLRVASDEPGVLMQLDSGEAVCTVLVDHRPVIRLGQGPLSIERRTPGVSSPRTFSSGEAEGEEPTFVDSARNTLSIRVRCRLETGRRAVYFTRVHLVGDPGDFRFRADVEKEGDESVIPRRRGSISITVPGAGKGSSRGRSTGRTNKPPAVIRPSKRPPRDAEN